MRFWKRSRLQVRPRGIWYLALTIALGVLALGTMNNIIYIMESLLLGSLILSGILSERTISAIEVEVHRFPVSAGSPTRDQLTVRNTGALPVFCVELGEWRDRKFVPIAFLPKLEGNSMVTLAASRTFELRGVYAWDGLVVATSYPFGLVRKLRVIDRPGSRLVWPRSRVSSRNPAECGSRVSMPRAGQVVSEGEIRPFDQDDDYRTIVWLLSAKGCGKLARPRRAETGDPEARIDLRQENGAEFEKEVERAADPFYRAEESAHAGTLTVIDWRGRRRFKGRTQALNQLASLRAAGSRP